MKRFLLSASIAVVCSFPLAAYAQAQGDYFIREHSFVEPNQRVMNSRAVRLLSQQVQLLEERHAPDAEKLPIMSALAYLLVTGSDIESARNLFDKCIAMHECSGDRTSAEYKNLLEGYLEVSLSDLEPSLAERILDKLLPLSNNFDIVHKLNFALVEIYSKKDQFDAAENLMLSSIRLNELQKQCFATEFFGAGQWYSARKRYRDAKVWYAKALERAKLDHCSDVEKEAESALKDMDRRIAEFSTSKS